MSSSYRILVVEDNPEWSKALCGMYKELYGVYPNTALSMTEAKEMLISGGPWDIVSLDLNLRGENSEDGIGNPGGYLVGKDVLLSIDRYKSARFVMCCTGIHSDSEIKGYIKEDQTGLIRKTMVTIPNQLETLFPGRNAYLNKNDVLEIEDNISDFKKVLSELREKIDIACGRIGILELDKKANVLRVNYKGKLASITFPKPGGFKTAEYLAFILAHAYSEWERKFTPRDVLEFRSSENVISLDPKGDIDMMAENLGDTFSSEGFSVGNLEGQKVTMLNDTERRNQKEQLKIIMKYQNEDPHVFENAIEDLKESLSKAQESKDELAVTNYKEKLDCLMLAKKCLTKKSDNLRKSVNIANRDPDYQPDKESKNLATYITRILEKLKEKHYEAWELLAEDGKGALMRPKNIGYYYYDDTRCGVKWKIIAPEEDRWRYSD